TRSAYSINKFKKIRPDLEFLVVRNIPHAASTLGAEGQIGFKPHSLILGEGKRVVVEVPQTAGKFQHFTRCKLVTQTLEVATDPVSATHHEWAIPVLAPDRPVNFDCVQEELDLQPELTRVVIHRPPTLVILLIRIGPASGSLVKMMTHPIEALADVTDGVPKPFGIFTGHFTRTIPLR